MMAHLARSGVKVAASVADGVRRPKAGLVVLLYHRVGARTPMRVDLPVELFDAQMEWLAAHADVVSLDEGLRWLEDPGPADDDGDFRVAVTFDDGTSDFVELALPVLVEHRVPATMFVATDFIESQRSFPYDGVPATWSGLAEAVSTGLVAIGSHTHSHALLDRIPDDEVDDELDRSVQLIGSRLGVHAAHFAYPKALPGSSEADRAIRARFSSASLAGGHANARGHTDPYGLARTPVQVEDGMKWFARKARGGLALEERLRGALSGRRYAGATT